MNQVKEITTIIDMIIPKYVEDKKMVLGEDLSIKIKLIWENIE